MVILKYLALVFLFAAVGLFVQAPYATLAGWWNRRLATYADWFADEFRSMFEEVTTDRARRVITTVIVVAFSFGFLFGSGIVGRLVLGVIFGVAGYLAPSGWVVWRRRKRLAAIDNELIDALLMMANGLKAGLSLQQTLELVVREMKPPIADEFGRVVREIHFGRLIDDALARLAERLPLEDIRLVVDSILTLRETGGNLANTFQVVSQTVVERKKVQGRIEAMTAQGMTQGVVICAMPIALMLLFSFIDPNYMHPLFTTPLGWMMLMLVFVLDALGMWLMLKLVKVDV